jgi:photosystem II stability/assembly factor-like uncharacterized protein
MARSTIITLAVILFICSVAEMSSAQWKQLSMPPVGTGIRNGVYGEAGCIQFQHGILWAGRDKLYVSADSGVSWTLQNFSSNGPICDIQFFDKSIGFLSSKDGLFFTTNGGTTWTRKTIFDGLTLLYASFNIAFGPSSQIMYGYDFTDGSFFVTRNGGATWHATNLCFTGALCFTVSRSGIIYVLAPESNSPSTQARLVSSSDEGVTWIRHSGVVDADCYTICADSSDDNTLYLHDEAYYGAASDVESNIMKTTDAGESWVALTHDPSKSYTGAMYYSGRTFYSGKHDNQIMRSTDNGKSWTICPCPQMSTDGRTITCINDNTVFVLDSLGYVWKAEYLCGDTLSSGHCIDVATADKKTDTIGGSVSVPIIVSGRSGPGTVELSLHYREGLKYIGAFSPAGGPLDLPGEQMTGRSRIRANNVTADTIGFAEFQVFFNADSKPNVQFDSVVIVGGPPCPLSALMDSALSTVSGPSGCGTMAIGSFLFYGKIPEFSLAANAVTSEIVIRSSCKRDNVKILFVDVLGNVIKTYTRDLKPGDNCVLPVENLANGMYTLEFITVNGQTFQHFVVQR